MRPSGMALPVIQSLAIFSVTALNEHKSEEKPNPWWASCKNSSVHNIHGKNLSIDNAFENQTISLDDYKGKTLLLLNVASF